MVYSLFQRAFSIRFWRRFWPWFLLFASLGIVRWSKGAGFSDFYAFVTRPVWPGSSQREWIQYGFQVEQQTKLKLLEQDNQRLRELLSLDGFSKTGKVSAAVISRSVSGWWQQLELNRGSIHGVKSGNPVIGPGGVLGIINSVTPTTSRVQLLTSPGSQIGVWIERTNKHGILVGLGTNRTKLTFLDKDSEANSGDIVTTSPASTLLPPNLSVGVIQLVKKDALPAPYAIVQLIASPEAIDWVQILTR